jgi:hypothetical protein
VPRYSVYGLTLESSEPLEGLADAPLHAVTDVILTFGTTPAWTGEPVARERFRSDEPSADKIVVEERPSGFSFRYGDGTAFDLDRKASALWCRFADPLVLADAAIYLLGPVLGFALRLRGVLCLHASAVVVDGRAVALMGPAGSGKSTTAGAFGAAGFGVLADDLAALRMEGSAQMVQSAYDHLRLWREGELALLGTSGALPRLTPTWDKRALDLTGAGYRFAREPAPLGDIVFLSDAAAAAASRRPALRRMPRAAAILAITGETYANYLLDAEMRRDELVAISALVGDVRVWELCGAGDGVAPSEMVETIVDGLRANR